jgi:ATP-dependent Clp protease, protease subunit
MTRLPHSSSTWPFHPEFPPPGVPPGPGREPAAPPGHRPATPTVPIVYEDAPATGPVTERLLDQRRILVSGPLDLARATDAAARLMYLDGSGDEPIELMMTCPDGELAAAASLADTIELVGVEVRALCIGSVGGPAVLPFAVASTRLAQRHATFVLFEPAVAVQGTATDVAAEATRHAALLADVHARLAAATGQSVDAVATDLRSRRRLSADEAQQYGLVDTVLTRHADAQDSVHAPDP